MRYLGVDLAWGEGSEAKPANRSGVVALEPSGTISGASWTIGLEATVDWIQQHAADGRAALRRRTSGHHERHGSPAR